MVAKNLLEPKEDLFQKSLHQEADFYKGIVKYNYKSAFFFALASAFILFFDICFIFVIVGMLISSVGSLSEMTLLDILLIVPVAFLFVIAAVLYRLTEGLVLVFIKKDRRFKIKAILILLAPVIIYAIIFFGLLNLIFNPPGWHG